MSTSIANLYADLKAHFFITQYKQIFFLTSRTVCHRGLKCSPCCRLPVFWEPAETDSHDGDFWPKVGPPDVG